MTETTTGKTETERKEPRVCKEIIQSPYKFTDHEKLEFGTKLAMATQRVENLTAHKKQVTSACDAQINEAKATVENLSGKLSSGMEYREKECVVKFRPIIGMKDYYDAQSGDFIQSSTMTRNDYQMDLALEQENAAIQKANEEAEEKAKEEQSIPDPAPEPAAKAKKAKAPKIAEATEEDPDFK